MTNFCDRPVLSDGGSFGVCALCLDCWSLYARAGHLLLPASPRLVHDDLVSGVIRFKPKLTVRKADGN